MALELRQDKESPAGFLPSALWHVSPVTLELFYPDSVDSFPVELEQTYPKALGWQRFLDLKKTDSVTMNRKNKQQGNYRLDLKLNLSPPKDGNNPPPLSSPSSYFSSSSSSENSPPSSCISSEHNSQNEPGWEGDQVLRYSNSPEGKPLVLVGCPRCLMYVMLSEVDPKCPKCKSACLLDFQDETNKKTTRDF